MASRSARWLSCVPSLRRPTGCVLRWAAANGGRRELSNATEIVQELKNRRLPIRIDNPVPGPADRLRVALADFLSPAPEQGSSLPTPPRSLLPGYHLVYFPPVTSEHELLEDGTDILHAPDKSWKYRLWAGGSLECDENPRLGAFSEPMALVERIGDVKVRDSKVFVQIQRAVVRTDRTTRASRSPTDTAAEERLRALAFPETGDPENPSGPTRDPILRETRWLCFMKDKPPTTTSPPKLNPPSREAIFSKTMTPTPSLLFRFSALTFNAHAIHIDAEYTKSVYGLPERLVQGPLTLVLMMEVARRALYERASRGGAKYIPTAIHYKNHAPIYVNEEITIACGELEDHPSGGSNASAKKSMSVWIQKMQDGQPTVCVSGTVTLAEDTSGFIPPKSAANPQATNASSRSEATGEDKP